jgi:hypothetical protein
VEEIFEDVEMLPQIRVKYLGVIQFVFHVLQLLPLRFTEWNLCCNRKSRRKHDLKSMDLP